MTAQGGLGGTALMSPGTSLNAVSGATGPGGGLGQVTSGGGNSDGALRLTGSLGLGGGGGNSQLGLGGSARASEGPGTITRGRGGGAGGAVSYGGAFNGADGGTGIVIIELYG